ncbi:F-box only protein 44-like [Nylanderia fulva]|uniref:F-box only protein 44-like n=1 Tax=Nylanderia fulva TaxID=613905 RepID=UPI0010FB12D4|nr:F-box only protein 44-like [Nylanderia fulva]
MGQSHDTIVDAPRVAFDEEGDNGLVICDRYVPPELLGEIFCRAHLRTLLNCQLVCKRWRTVIQSYVWRKKTELVLGKPFPRQAEEIPWQVFYLTCKRRPFERNLLRNHSGGQKMKHWEILSNGGDSWRVEVPPAGVLELPLTEPIFGGKQVCFATSYHNCTKRQTVNLLAKGFHPYVLDVLQPPIEVSEWYSCRWDCPAMYECEIELLGLENDQKTKKVLDKFQFRDTLEGDKQNKWLHISHVFKNYGHGLREISFLHGGMDNSFWAGHYGSKMAGACISIKFPPATTHIYGE